MAEFICGIQQVGIGTDNLENDWNWYRKAFSMDIGIFVDEAEAPLMTQYTGGKVQNRVAALAMNMQGGGGFEIWQYKSRKPERASFDIKMGDLGFIAVKLKTNNADKSYADLKAKGVQVLTAVRENPAGKKNFYVQDPAGNWFNIVEAGSYFKNEKNPTGGVFGSVIGVSDMDKSIAFYKDLLGFDIILADSTGFQDDLKGVSENIEYRRLILGQSSQETGPFNPLLGTNQIELIQRVDGKGRQIFADRFWGDLGFIHLCFDVRRMSHLKKKAAELGYPFTVDSADSFDMGKAAGRFGYVEDPDGALIEFVETHKLPIVEKWGWYLDLQNRKQGKSLPKWLLKCFRFNRVKS
jgi:catechol 2,3-dioxygenase-like lactoylglutathione lyase family enzyme